MTYVKAEVPEEVHSQMRVEAAELDVTIDEIAKRRLVEAYSE